MFMLIFAFDVSTQDELLLVLFSIARSLLSFLIQLLLPHMNMKSTNLGALSLYEKLGFARDEKLARYYLNGGRSQLFNCCNCSPVSPCYLNNYDFRS